MDRLMVEKARVNSLVRAFVQREAAIGIIGLGYVGLPLMLSACRSGHTVVGFDIDHEKVKNLNQGKSPLAHIGDNNISRKVLDECLFEATSCAPPSISSVRWRLPDDARSVPGEVEI